MSDPVSGTIAVTSTVMNMSAERSARRERNAENARQTEELERRAKVAIGEAQREAMEIQHQADLLASRALAVAAFGGGGTDMDLSHIIADIHGEAALQQSILMYRGEEEARQLRSGIQPTVDSGYKYRQTAHLLRGFSSLYEAYGGSSPDINTDSYDSDIGW